MPYRTMLKVRFLPIFRSQIRRITTKTAPFKAEDIQGDEQYNDINTFYSDLFTSDSTQSGTKDGGNKHLGLAGEEDEISEINREMAELYGVDTLTDTPTDQIEQATTTTTTTTTKSLLQIIQQNKPAVFISTSTNPFKNLALEDYIFTHTPNTPPFQSHRLIFYINSPCVVVGKNQNPWKEANISLLQSLQIPLLRRRSGGGTVVHDLRNVNYSYITTRQDFDRSFFGKVIVQSINDAQLGVELDQNARGDIITKKDGLKVSGSAFKISKGKSYHHGTMLLDSKLDVLRQLLNTKSRDANVTFRCGSVDSVPSPVTNIGLTNEEFMEVVTEGFFELYGEQVEIVHVTEGELPQEVLATESELQQWEWRFGNTPKFEIDIVHPDFKITFNVEKGLLKKFSVDRQAEHFQYLQQVLENGESIRFTGSDIAGYVLNEEYGEFIGQHIDGSD